LCITIVLLVSVCKDAFFIIQAFNILNHYRPFKYFEDRRFKLF